MNVGVHDDLNLGPLEAGREALTRIRSWLIRRRTLAAPGQQHPFSPAMSDNARRRSHFLPRTRDGRMATIAFLVLFLLAMPPITHTVLNRIDPWIFGLPFFYVTLLAVYSALVLVLIWAFRRGI